MTLTHCACHRQCHAEFYVDGTTIPDVDWDIGPSWSGLLPISSDPKETRKVRAPSVSSVVTSCNAEPDRRLLRMIFSRAPPS